MDHCRVVLVRPRIAANMGATARVMRNFGLSRLVLVHPEAEIDDPRGRLLATHSQDILDQARIVQDLGEAVDDCVVVAGTSARTGGLFRRQSVGPPEHIVPHLLAVAPRPAALVFGPEPSGLTDAEVSRCHYLIHIPTDAAYPALNLAQAVAICLYELRRLWLARTQPAHADPELASFAEQEQMFERLHQALQAVHFVYGDKAEALMHGVRHLLGKARLTRMEIKLLLGLSRQLLWIAARGLPSSPE
jgi:tRNA/rRNA methyltransferase